MSTPSRGIRHPTGWVADGAGHWIWQGAVYHQRAYASVGGCPMPANRLLWMEAYGPNIPPKGAHLQSLCRVRCCVKPEHQRLRNAKMTWRSLRRDKTEIELAKLYLKMHQPVGLCWQPDQWTLNARDVTYAAGHLKLDVLAVIAAWSELAASCEVELELDKPPDSFDLEQTAKIIAQDIESFESAKQNPGQPT